MTDPGGTDLGIVDALAQLSFVVQATLARRGSEHDLSLVQVRLLGVLRDRTPGMAEVAGVLGLDRSSVTGLVDRASARGLVTRVPSEHDGRSVRVELTAAGRRLVEDVEQSFGGDVQSLVGVLSSAQRATLSRLASRVVDAS